MKENRSGQIPYEEDHYRRKKGGFKTVSFIILILLGLWALTIDWSVNRPVSITPTPITPEVSVAPATPAVPAPPTPTTKVLLKEVAPGIPESAIPKAGNGIEHCIKRQLDPTRKLVFVNDKGEKVDLSFKGDIADSKAVKKWVDDTSHKISILHHYFDPKTGNEVRIKAPGIVAYVLITEGDKIAGVKECQKDKDGKLSAQECRLQETTTSYANAQFKGNVDGGIQPYEYLWTPQMASEPVLKKG